MNAKRLAVRLNEIVATAIQEKEREIASLRAALEAYPEWIDDEGDLGSMNSYVSCLICGGGGKFNSNGKPSKRMPPTHKPDCLRVLALTVSLSSQED